MNEMLEYLKIIFTVQLFYAFAVTLILYSLPVDATTGIPGGFETVAQTYSDQTIVGELESNFHS